MTTRLSSNNEAIFHRNVVHKSIIESGVDKSTNGDVKVLEGLLHGATVDVFVGNSVHQCIIKSGIEGPQSFIAQSESSGVVRQRFASDVAKMLRQQGLVPNMRLV